MPRSTPLALLLAALTVHLAPAPAPAAELVLLRARCVDPLARTVEERSVWISGSTIAALGAPDGGDLPASSAGAARLDLAGAYVLPALADAWVHAGTQRAPGHRDRVGARGTAQLMLAAGVVEFVDVHLGSEAVLERERTGAGPVARLRVGGPLITAPGGVASDLPGARQVRDAAAMTSLVDSLATLPASLRPDLVAFVYDGSRRQPRLADAALRAGLVRAAAGGLAAAVQVGTWRDAYDALELGARWLVHLPFGPVPEQLADRVGQLDVVWTPALAIGQDFAALVTEPALREDPLLAAVLPEALRADYAQVRVPQGRLTEVAQRRGTLTAALAVLRDRGVRLRAGSSAGAVGTAYGWSLLRELEWMVTLGVDPWDALASALPAHHRGSRALVAGGPSDLMVLGRSPLDDMSALRAVEAVVIDGERLDPRALAAAVARTIEEEIPANPLPLGGRVPMVVLVAGGFVLLLIARRAIKRAAARAASADL